MLTITGCSDDLVELSGDINEEIAVEYDNPQVYLTFSDGTTLFVKYECIWKIRLITKGTLFNRIEQGDDIKDIFDIAFLNEDSKHEIKWCVVGNQFIKNEGMKK